MYPLHRQRELEFTMRCLLPLKCRTANIRRANASHAIPSVGQHTNSRRSTTHLPTKHALPQTPLTQTTCKGNQVCRFHTSTNIPEHCQSSACTQQGGAIRTFSPHRSFHPTPHPPRCNPLTNAHPLTTPSTAIPAITHLLHNSSHATQTVRTIDA